VRSRTGYWIAGGLIVAGLLGGVLWFVGSLLALRNEVDDFQRVALPGRATMELEARKYVIYSESSTGDESVPELRIAVTDTQTGRALRLAPYESSLTYSFSGRDGTARATVKPLRPGKYRVSTDTSTPTSGATVALGRSLAWPILRGILIAFAIGGVLVISGGTLLAITAIRRSRMSRATASPAARPSSGG
jgi:hypothetical protein